MTLISYLILNSGLHVGVKYLARCLLADLLMLLRHVQSFRDILFDTVPQSPALVCNKHSTYRNS